MRIVDAVCVDEAQPRGVRAMRVGRSSVLGGVTEGKRRHTKVVDSDARVSHARVRAWLHVRGGVRLKMGATRDEIT